MKQSHVNKLNKIALEMLSHSYFFSHTAAIHPSLKTLGMCRVTAVVINESSAPDLLLLEPDSQDPNYYHMEELEVSLVLDSTG